MEQYRPLRFPVHRRGFVSQDKKTTLCEVLDLTDGALQFKADLPLAISDIVAIEIQLDADCIIHCQIVVTHTNRPHFAGRFTRLSQDHRQQLARHIERFIQSCMADPWPLPFCSPPSEEYRHSLLAD